MASMTKAQLAAENATLRAEVSTLRTQVAALQHHIEGERHISGKPAPKATHAEAEYTDYAEAAANCRRLACSPLNQRYVFTQVGTRVIARAR